MWLKYAAEPIVFDRRRYVQPATRHSFLKPVGFWVTDDSDWNWKHWCEQEDFSPEALVCCHVVELDERRILFLRSAADLRAFTRQYQPSPDLGINWIHVAREHSGIIITPYIWECRLSRMDWYYTWDCASGCIWDAEAIVRVSHSDMEDWPWPTVP